MVFFNYHLAQKNGINVGLFACASDVYTNAMYTQLLCSNKNAFLMRYHNVQLFYAILCTYKMFLIKKLTMLSIILFKSNIYIKRYLATVMQLYSGLDTVIEWSRESVF